MIHEDLTWSVAFTLTGAGSAGEPGPYRARLGGEQWEGGRASPA
jgi:hypothetical protein